MCDKCMDLTAVLLDYLDSSPISVTICSYKHDIGRGQNPHISTPVTVNRENQPAI